MRVKQLEGMLNLQTPQPKKQHIECSLNRILLNLTGGKPEATDFFWGVINITIAYSKAFALQ